MSASDTIVHRANTPPPPTPLTPAEIAAFLDYALESLGSRRDEIIQALTANFSKYPTIQNDDALGVIAENMRMAGVLARTAEKRREEHKEPFLNGGRAVDVWFKAWKVPLENISGKVQKLMDDYGAQKLAAQRATAEAERKRAQAEADRAAEVAAAELRKGRSAQAALDVAAAAAAQAEEAETRSQARAPDLTRSTGIFGATASVRETWDHEVLDASKVPRKYLVVSEALIKLAMRDRDATGRPIAVIPGIRWKATTKMGVR